MPIVLFFIRFLRLTFCTSIIKRLFFPLRVLVSTLPHGRTSYERHGADHQRRGMNSPPKTSERLSTLQRFYMDNAWVPRGNKWRSSKFGIEFWPPMMINVFLFLLLFCYFGECFVMFVILYILFENFFH